MRRAGLIDRREAKLSFQGFPEHFLQHNQIDACDRCFLEWLSVRIVNLYRENPGIDFLLRLRRIATKFLVKS